ncbi:MAG: P-loop NTPase fold protein [Nostoc sp. DedQUE05]|uniref:P-loop NTPase fold protein n=1 Tax=Nostoc sp. DedQUE05 TaxID=3075391 RepID=UPI002AD4D9D8|nr:P-loop NTPase fold protein [Nostoc sp. DedQUE05]MDZ8090521.1 P-loop NTPase fold protein [Nostoc sp. DedQUE05]
MPLENLFTDEATANAPEEQPKLLYKKFGVLSNPFPSAGQTSGHPHMSTEADKQVDAAVKTFYSDRKSHVISITASQGIGKTNLLNAYENALREKLSQHGFFVIRYVPDPEPFFDPLIRSIFENLGEDYLRRSIDALAKRKQEIDDIDKLLGFVRMSEIKIMLKALLSVINSEEKLNERLSLAYQWLLGLPVRKTHQTELGVNFRLDTVEAKTRALRDIVYFGSEMKTLEGIFILLDELEKQNGSLSKTIVLRYLSALRALIDALPKYLFLMVALTTDALERYREMLPAIRGRLANEVQLSPIRNEEEAVKLFKFYLEQAKMEARNFAQNKQLQEGNDVLLHEDSARLLFHQLLRGSNIKGVRQRDYLNALYEKADESIHESMPAFL